MSQGSPISWPLAVGRTPVTGTNHFTCFRRSAFTSCSPTCFHSDRGTVQLTLLPKDSHPSGVPQSLVKEVIKSNPVPKKKECWNRTTRIDAWSVDLYQMYAFQMIFMSFSKLTFQVPANSESSHIPILTFFSFNFKSPTSNDSPADHLSITPKNKPPRHCLALQFDFQLKAL